MRIVFRSFIAQICRNEDEDVDVDGELDDVRFETATGTERWTDPTPTTAKGWEKARSLRAACLICPSSGSANRKPKFPFTYSAGQ